MPCSDGGPSVRPGSWEKHINKTASLLDKLRNMLYMKVDARALRCSVAEFPTQTEADYVTSELCRLLKGLDSETMERLVYDAHNPISRKLADWWEKHQQEDREREAAEREEKLKEMLRESALAKLTEAERRVLGL